MVFSAGRHDGRFTLLYQLAHQGAFDAIKGPEYTQRKVVQSDPNRCIFLELGPGMARVEVVALRELESPNLKKIDRVYDSVDRILFIKELIEIAIAALILMRTDTKFDTSFHVMHAWTPRWRLRLQLLSP